MYKILITLLLCSPQIIAQRFGGNPPSLKWKQINTDTARIIFPAGLDKEAEDVSAIVHELAGSSQYSIGAQLRKINIVLQNQTLISNGYVALGPYRSEFFLTPRQDNFELGSLPWHKTLALHEYRHVQQYNNFRKGISKIAYYLFGEQGQALANGISVPDWFFEGDAVYQETIMSGQGRGRIPYFFNPYRSVWSADKNYSWMKLRNGSLRDMVPDHYHLGYMMVNYGRTQYGDSIWRKISGDAAAYKGLFYPLQRAVKKYTGENYSAFRLNAMQQFKLPVQSDSASSYGRSNIHFKADEEFPQWMNASEIIYLKTTYKNIPAFYVRNFNTGEERKIAVKDISIDNYFSYRNGKIVYASYRPDARWVWKNYGEINIQDTAGAKRTITHKTKYLSPDISADGSLVVAVNADPSGKNTLHILNATTGALIKEVSNKDSLVFTQPKFYNNNTIISAVRNGISNPVDGSFKIVLPYDKNYSIRASADHFFAISENLKLDSLIKAGYKEIHKDLYLAPIEIGAVVRLNNVFFDFDKWDLRPESYIELNRVVTLLKENPAIEIEMSAHTDSYGSDDYNYKLSDNRARSVMDYIIAQGINSRRIISQGYGETKPVADNLTDENRQLNRRVEFKILKN